MDEANPNTLLELKPNNLDESYHNKVDESRGNVLGETNHNNAEEQVHTQEQKIDRVEISDIAIAEDELDDHPSFSELSGEHLLLARHLARMWRER